MPRGTKDIVERGKNTRFSGQRAAEAGERGRAAARANRPIRMCLRHIATEALYGKPPLSEAQLQPVAEFFGIKVGDVTFAHLAIFKQSVEMAKGDPSALNLVAAYAGEKPTENISVTAGNFDALNEAFEALKESDQK